MVHIPSEQEFGDFAQWKGRSVQGRDGGTIGQVEEIFLDTDTRQPEWVLVTLPGDDGLRLVPLADAQVSGETLTVGYADDLVRSSPRFERAEPVAQSQERELYSHYGVEYSHEGSGTGLPSGADAETAGTATAGGEQRAGDGDGGGAAAVRVDPDAGGDTEAAVAAGGAAAGGAAAALAGTDRPEPGSDADTTVVASAPGGTSGTATPVTPAGGAGDATLDREHAREDLAEAPATETATDAQPAVDFSFPSTSGDEQSGAVARLRDPKVLGGAGALLLLLLALVVWRQRS